ncbi:hypothetical protein NON00_21760 [Roseomonas sp. GC11]|uniref:extracellular solute-binding protein n=1 Tax=Roseomonas sp. GC11 TaxID=2950546 RepID=UPI00210D2CCA|nr:extracellular solute-binding protein [Roseomonas sp. GC11]MCQ4162541.1 hypothetical protein [Roseomonas sp. GC11]
MASRLPRRRLLAAALPALAPRRAATASPPPGGTASQPPGGTAAAGPITLRFLDTSETVQGGLLFQRFAAARPDLVASVSVARDQAEALFGALRAGVEAGNPPYDAVLTTLDGAVAGAELGLWQPLAPLLHDRLPPQDALLTPLARLLRGVVREQAQIVVASPGGPLLAYAPGQVPRLPATPAELLAWARQNPRRFLYPRPDLSEAGRCFVAGLPWILRDRDPLDPREGWPATWAFLAELDRHVAYYPTTGQAAMQELAEGGVHIAATTLGGDVMARATGLLPRGTGLGSLLDFHWVPVGLFVGMPRGLQAARQDIMAAAVASLLEASFQSRAFGHGQYWPGPVRQGITLAEAPPRQQAELRRVVRPGTQELIARHPFAPPLLLEQSLFMLRRWSEEIGAWHGVRP